MSIFKVFAATAVAATLGWGNAQAQSLKNGLVPAEFPSASYKGRQYVDSDGCVFIRAGVDGNITWVPRVTRNRKIICGFQPTFSRQSPKASQSIQSASTPQSESSQLSNAQVVRTQQGSTVATVQHKRKRRATKVSYTPAKARPKRVIPRHVYENQKLSVPGITVPKGYKPAWDDDRLNPYRAYQTLAGKEMMDKTWTQTLPRRLVRHDK